MKISNLMRYWETSTSDMLTIREYCVRLPLRDAARVAALVEMYPSRSETEILSELVSAALGELEESMPYIAGRRVIAEDDRGDPIYEDVGPTPRFIALTEKHLRILEKKTSLSTASSEAESTSAGK